MKTYQRKLIVERLNSESEKLTKEIVNYEIGSKEYIEKWDQIFKIEELLNEVKKPKSKFRIDKEWIPVIGSLLSIILIMNHEKADVITTKALGFVKKA